MWRDPLKHDTDDLISEKFSLHQIGSQSHHVHIIGVVYQCIFIIYEILIYLHAAPPQDFDVRLVGGTNKSEGRVEIFYNNEWGTVCDDIWDLRDATVVCRQLGYPVAIRRVLHAGFGEGTGRIWLDDVACAGNESNLNECAKTAWGVTNCNHGEDAGVICGGK